MELIDAYTYIGTFRRLRLHRGDKAFVVRSFGLNAQAQEFHLCSVDEKENVIVVQQDIGGTMISIPYQSIYDLTISGA